eukprot:TRINITY_DN49244_c1_g2_i1.p1 TRINITY_DN49244_c1_g2~~TRINITY_DN49244_c1_g2_i1.p1  ORF type:complete len:1026 (+),score=70.37 TRINITY_DN49244_c1_g2_i1:161-3238(+)
MPQAFRLHAVILAAAIRTRSVDAACFPDAIPATKRVVVDGESMPLGLWMHTWESAILASHVFRIVAEEVLGYEVVLSPPGGLSVYAVWVLAGCLPEQDCLHNESLRVKARRYHIALDTYPWADEVLGDWQEKQPARAPIRFRHMGYTGVDSTFISSTTSYKGVPAGLVLNVYSSYNASAHDVSPFFSRIHDIDTSLLSHCNSTATRKAVADQGYVNAYAEAFPSDVEGYFKDKNGHYWPTCPDGNWWLAPACRDNPSKCIPWITHQAWRTTVHMQRATLYNMPLAIGFTRNFTAYEHLPRAYDLLTHWWKPDSTFLELDMKMVLFPVEEHSYFGQRVGLRGGIPHELDKWVMKDFRAWEAVLLTQRFRIEPEGMDGMLRQLMSGKDAFTVACEFLTGEVLEKPAWARWIPKAADCVQGQGLADANGHPVNSTGNATQCIWCASGSFSRYDSEAQGYVCTQCATGKFSSLLGESSCDDCEKGRFSNSSGQTSCRLCARGRYASKRGSSNCTVCPTGFMTADVGETDSRGCVCQLGTYYSSDIDNGTMLCLSCGWLHTTKSVGATSTDDCILDTDQLGRSSLLIIAIVCFCALLVVADLFRRFKSVLQEESMRKTLKQGFRSISMPQHPMCLMPFLCFSALTEDDLLTCYEGARDRGSLLMLDKAQDVHSFQASGRKVLFFSYTWTSWRKVGPNMSQLACMKAAAKEVRDRNDIDPEHLYIWIDVLGIPQASDRCKALAIDSLFVYASMADYLVVVCPEGLHENTDEAVGVETYKSRTWCRVEQMAHFSCRGLGTMWYSMRPGELRLIDEEWLRDVVHIFDGKMTCCTLGHPGRQDCDRQLLVPSVLAMYTVLLKRMLSGAPADIQAIWRMMNEDRTRTFPRSFVYNDSGKARHLELFGWTVDRIHDVMMRSDAPVQIPEPTAGMNRTTGMSFGRVSTLRWQDVAFSLVSSNRYRKRSNEVSKWLMEAVEEAKAAKGAAHERSSYHRRDGFRTKTQLERCERPAERDGSSRMQPRDDDDLTAPLASL